MFQKLKLFKIELKQNYRNEKWGIYKNFGCFDNFNQNSSS